MENDMKEVLDRLAEINSASAKIMKSTNHEKVAYADFIKQKTADYDAEIKSKIEKEVEELRVKIIAENSALLEENKKELEQTLEVLDEAYKTNGDKWAQEIFEHIIKE